MEERQSVEPRVREKNVLATAEGDRPDGSGGKSTYEGAGRLV